MSRGGLLHALPDPLQQGRGLSPEKSTGRLHALHILRARYAADAGRGAEAYDIINAVPVILGARAKGPALTEAKGLFDKIHGGARGHGINVRPQIDGAIVFPEANGLELGPGLGKADLKHEETFIIPQVHIIAGLVVLDQLSLGQQGLGLIAGHQDVEIVHAADQPAQLGIGLDPGSGPEIGLHALPQGERLADIDDFPAAVAHHVTSRLIGKFLKLAPHLVG